MKWPLNPDYIFYEINIVKFYGKSKVLLFGLQSDENPATEDTEETKTNNETGDTNQTAEEWVFHLIGLNFFLLNDRFKIKFKDL